MFKPYACFKKSCKLKRRCISAILLAEKPEVDGDGQLFHTWIMMRCDRVASVLRSWRLCYFSVNYCPVAFPAQRQTMRLSHISSLRAPPDETTNKKLMQTAEAVSSHIPITTMVIIHSISTRYLISLVWGLETPRVRKLGQPAYATVELWASSVRPFIVLGCREG